MKPTLTICTLLVALSNSTFAQQQRDLQLASPTDSIEICIPLMAGWQLVSNPVRRAPGTDSIWQVFCGTTGCPLRYGWGGGYVTRLCTVRNGEGFWLKNPPPTFFCCIGGETIEQDSIPVTNQWNLIGTISHPVAASSVTSIPPNIRVSGFFGYSSRYVVVDTLRPGCAYWVRVNQSGQLVLSSGL